MPRFFSSKRSKSTQNLHNCEKCGTKLRKGHIVLPEEVEPIPNDDPVKEIIDDFPPDLKISDQVNKTNVEVAEFQTSVDQQFTEIELREKRSSNSLASLLVGQQQTSQEATSELNTGFTLHPGPEETQDIIANDDKKPYNECHSIWPQLRDRKTLHEIECLAAEDTTSSGGWSDQSMDFDSVYEHDTSGSFEDYQSPENYFESFRISQRPNYYNIRCDTRLIYMNYNETGSLPPFPRAPYLCSEYFLRSSRKFIRLPFLHTDYQNKRCNLQYESQLYVNCHQKSIFPETYRAFSDLCDSAEGYPFTDNFINYFSEFLDKDICFDTARVVVPEYLNLSDFHVNGYDSLLPYYFENSDTYKCLHIEQDIGTVFLPTRKILQNKETPVSLDSYTYGISSGEITEEYFENSYSLNSFENSGQTEGSNADNISLDKDAASLFRNNRIVTDVLESETQTCTTLERQSEGYFSSEEYKYSTSTCDDHSVSVKECSSAQRHLDDDSLDENSPTNNNSDYYSHTSITEPHIGNVYQCLPRIKRQILPNKKRESILADSVQFDYLETSHERSKTIFEESKKPESFRENDQSEVSQIADPVTSGSFPRNESGIHTTGNEFQLPAKPERHAQSLSYFSVEDYTSPQCSCGEHTPSSGPEHGASCRRHLDKRETAEFVVGSKGGDFQLFNSQNGKYQVNLSFSKGAVTDKTQITLIRSTNKSDFPASFSTANHLSDVIHCSPHHLQFRAPVRLDIPYNCPLTHIKGVKLMYNDADINQVPKWRFISKKQNHNDPTYQLNEGYCSIWLSHFCSFVLVKNSQGDEFTGTILAASLKAEYNRDSKIIEITTIFQPTCQPIERHLESTRFPFFTKLGQEHEDVSVTVDLPGDWQYLCYDKPEKKMWCFHLIHIDGCKDPELHPKVSWTAKNHGHDENEVLELCVVIKQPVQHARPVYLKKAVTLNQIARPHGNTQTKKDNTDLAIPRQLVSSEVHNYLQGLVTSTQPRANNKNSRRQDSDSGLATDDYYLTNPSQRRKLVARTRLNKFTEEAKTQQPSPGEIQIMHVEHFNLDDMPRAAEYSSENSESQDEANPRPNQSTEIQTSDDDRRFNRLATTLELYERRQ